MKLVIQFPTINKVLTIRIQILRFTLKQLCQIKTDFKKARTFRIPLLEYWGTKWWKTLLNFVLILILMMSKDNLINITVLNLEYYQLLNEE